MMNRHVLATLGVLAAVLVAAAALTLPVRVADADGSAACTAHLGGLETAKKMVPELVVFNVTASELTFDLVIRGADGAELVNRPGGVIVPARATVTVSLQEELSRDLPPKTKAYTGVLSLDLTADAPFGPDSAIIHVTQYIGKRKNPKAAFVLRPIYSGTDDV